MAVHSNTFGGLCLTGEDAKKFRSQTRTTRASAAATRSALRGIENARKLVSDGSVTIDNKPK